MTGGGATGGRGVPAGFAPIDGPSPFGRLLGPIHERPEEGGAFARGLRIEDRHTNLGGVVHGGVLMSFADVVLGTVSYRHAGRPGASIRMVSDFVAPARVGDWLEGRGAVTKATRSIVFAAGELTVDGRTILTMAGTYKLLGEPRDADRDLRAGAEGR